MQILFLQSRLRRLKGHHLILLWELEGTQDGNLKAELNGITCKDGWLILVRSYQEPGR